MPSTVCPRCKSSERTEVIAAPRHNPDARFFCSPCNLVFTGSQSEFEAEVHRAVVLGRERSEWIVSAHIAEARVNEIKETF